MGQHNPKVKVICLVQSYSWGAIRVTINGPCVTPSATIRVTIDRIRCQRCHLIDFENSAMCVTIFEYGAMYVTIQ